MNIEYLREFIVLSKSPSLNRAARKLSMSPSTLSRHMTDLERELKATLLKRGSVSIELTHAGEVFLEEACSIVNLYEESLLKTMRAKGVLDAPIVVGGHFRVTAIERLYAATVALITREVTPLRPSVFEPHCSPLFETLTKHNAIDTLVNGTVDILILTAFRPHEHENLESTVLYRDPLAVLVSKNHPLAGREEPVALDELRDLTLITNNFYHEQVEHVLQVIHDAGVNIKTETRIFRSLGDQYVDKGVGTVSIIPLSSVGKLPPTSISNLVALKVKDEAAHFDTSAVWRKGDDNKAIKMYLDSLKRAAYLIENE